MAQLQLTVEEKQFLNERVQVLTSAGDMSQRDAGLQALGEIKKARQGIFDESNHSLREVQINQNREQAASQSAAAAGTLNVDGIVPRADDAANPGMAAQGPNEGQVMSPGMGVPQYAGAEGLGGTIASAFGSRSRPTGAGEDMPRHFGAGFTMGLPPLTPGIGTGTWGENAVSETMAAAGWGAVRGLTVGVVPALLKWMEDTDRNLGGLGGMNWYPDWLDDPKNWYSRVGLAAGEFATFLTPGGTKAAFKLGGKIGAKLTGGIARGTMAAIGKKGGARAAKKVISATVEEVGEEVGEAAVERMISQGIPVEQATKKGFKKMLTGWFKKADEIKTMKKHGSLEGYINTIRETSPAAAKDFADDIVGKTWEAVDDEVARFGFDRATNDWIKKGIRTVSEARTIDGFMDVARSPLGYKALLAVDKGMTVGFTLAVKNVIDSFVSMIPAASDERKYILAGIPDQSVKTFSHGLLFGAIGMIPNLGRKSPAKPLKDILKAFGIKDKQAKAYAKNVMSKIVAKDGVVDPKQVKKLLKLYPEFEKMDSERILNIGRKISAIFDSGMMDSLRNYAPTIADGTMSPGNAEAIRGELDVLRWMARKGIAKAASGEALKEFFRSAPRMLAGAAAMTGFDMVRDWEQVEAHPEDFVWSALTSMYFTRHANAPAVPIEMGGKERAYTSKNIDDMKLMLAAMGTYMPEIKMDARTRRMMNRAIKGTPVIKSVASDTKIAMIRGRVKDALARGGKMTTMSPEDIREWNSSGQSEEIANFMYYLQEADGMTTSKEKPEFMKNWTPEELFTVNQEMKKIYDVKNFRAGYFYRDMVSSSTNDIRKITENHTRFARAQKNVLFAGASKFYQIAYGANDPGMTPERESIILKYNAIIHSAFKSEILPVAVTHLPGREDMVIEKKSISPAKLEMMEEIAAPFAAEFARFVGNNDARTFYNPHVDRLLEQQTIKGGYHHINDFQSGRSRFYPSDLNINGKEVGMVSNKMVDQMLLETGFRDNKGLVEMVNYDDLEVKPKNLSRKAYNALQGYVETLPFGASGYGVRENAPMKLEVTGPEAEVVNALGQIFDSTGLAINKTHTAGVIEEGIRRRFLKMTPTQVQIMGVLRKNKWWNPETNIVDLPAIVGIAGAAGSDREYAVFTPLEKFKGMADYDSFVNQLNVMADKGSFAKMNVSGFDKVGGKFKMREGAFLLGQNTEALNEVMDVYRSMKSGLGMRTDRMAIISEITDQVIQDKTQTPEIKDLITAKIATLAYGRQFGGYLELREAMRKHGIIAIGTDRFEIKNYKKLFSDDFAREMDRIAISELGSDFEFATVDAVRRAEAIKEDLMYPEHLEVAREPRLSLQKFQQHSQLTPLNMKMLSDQIYNGKLKTGQDLKKYALEDDAILGMSKEWMAKKNNMTHDDWNAVVLDIKTKRNIPVIQYYDESSYLTTDTRPWRVEPHFTYSGFVDDLRADGLNPMMLSSKMYRGGMKAGTKGDTVSMFGITGMIERVFNKLLNSRGELGTIEKVAGELGTPATRVSRKIQTQLVPVMVGSEKSLFVYRMPQVHTENYERLHKAMGNVRKILDLKYPVKEGQPETTLSKMLETLPVNDPIRSAFKSLDAVLKNMEKPNMELDPKSWFELGISPNDLSSAMHMYNLVKGFTPDILLTYAEGRNKSLNYDDHTQLDEAIKTMTKRAGLQQNVQSQPLDRDIGIEAAKRANAVDLSGAKIPEDGYVDVVFVDDIDMMDGHTPMSERAAYWGSKAVGSNDIHRVMKANFRSQGMLPQGADPLKTPGMPVTTKTAFAVYEYFEPMLESMGANYVIPTSAAKWLGYSKDVVKALGLQDFYKNKTAGAKVFRIPYEGLRTIYEKQSGLEHATLIPGTEMGFKQGPMLDWMKEHFTRDGINGNPWFDVFRQVDLLATARHGFDHEAVKDANAYFKLLYKQSDKMGIIEDPGYSSAHRNFIFASEDNNPMDQAFYRRSMKFLHTRLVKPAILKHKAKHGAQTTLMHPIHDVGEDADWHFRGSREMGGIGEAIGAPGEKYLSFTNRTVAAIEVNGKNVYREEAGPDGKPGAGLTIADGKIFKYALKHGEYKASNDFKAAAKAQGHAVDAEGLSAYAARLVTGDVALGGNMVLAGKPRTVERFNNVLDWLYVGGTQDPNSNHKHASISYDYMKKIRLRPKMGYVDLNQRNPKVRKADTFLSKKMGTSDETNGQISIYAKSDAIGLGQGDYDIDQYNNYIDVPVKVIDEIVNTQKLLGSSEVANVQIDQMKKPARINRDFNPTKATGKNSWGEYHEIQAKAQFGVGRATNAHQAYYWYANKKASAMYFDPVEKRNYFIEPLYGDHEGLVKAGGKHLILAQAQQQFTDAPGMWLDKYWTEGEWVPDVYEKMFHRVYASEKMPGTPDRKITKPLDKVDVRQLEDSRHVQGAQSRARFYYRHGSRINLQDCQRLQAQDYR